MSFRSKIIAVNALIIIVFVTLLTYSSVRVVQDASIDQYNKIKESITSYNKGLLQTFVRAQSLSLNKEVDLINEGIEHVSKEFSSGYKEGSNSQRFFFDRLTNVNGSLKDFINEVTIVDIVESKEEKIVGSHLVSNDFNLDFENLTRHRSFFVGKSYLNKQMIEFSIFVPLKYWHNKMLRFKLNLDYFASSLAFDNMVDGLQYRYFIIDGRGKLVTSNLKQNAKELLAHQVHKRKELESVSNYILSREIGSLSIDSILGGYDVTFIRNAKTGWRLILVTPESVVGSNYIKAKEVLLSSDAILVKKFIVISIALLTIFVAVNSVIINELFSPISQLISQAKFLKDRNFNKATEVIKCYGGEIEQLSRVYSETGIQIQLMLEELEGQVAQRTIQYENAAKQASEANAQKSNLLSNVSHEIRTPLNAVIGYTNMLSSSSLYDTHAREVRGISSASHTILKIVNDLLDYERTTTLGYELNPGNTSVYELLEYIKSTFEPIASSKGLTFEVISELNGRESIYVDELRLKQCINNMVANAIKFTPTGSIVVQCSSLNGEFSISVTDTGIGIPKEKLCHIFNGFEQVNREDQQFGFGLGLAITKQIVQLMNGELNVISELGSGSVFTLVLSSDECRKSFRPQAKCKEANLITVKDESFEGIKILVVDDVEYNREILDFHLTQLGCVCVHASNGLEALEHAKQFDFDIVLTDISMPEMDGVQLSQELYQSRPLLPVIAVTARATSREKARMESFFKCYLTKPIDVVDLKSKLACALNLGRCS